jgi:rhamnosyltransferase
MKDSQDKIDQGAGPGPTAVDVAERSVFCSLVIPTKNGGSLFHRVIERLKAQQRWSEVDFVVIDSGSTDDTIAVAQSAGARVVQIPPAEFNHGATRDRAIELARSEIVVLLVQDAVAEDDRTLINLVACFDDPQVAGAYARQIPQPTADALTKRNLNNWLTGRSDREERMSKGEDWFQALPAMEKYFFCNFDNVCSAVRKSVWSTHRFGRINFGEDIDWAERVLRAGWKIVYEPAAAVVHSHDRPVSYEYKRTYVCHRKLYSQFGLHLVPSLKGIGRSWRYSTVQDWKYVLDNEPRLGERLRLLGKVPLLNILGAYAQYKAVQDEMAGQENRVRGV